MLAAARSAMIYSLVAIIAAAGVAFGQTDDSLSPLIHLELNLPAYRLDVFARHERVRVYRPAIGMPDFHTPRGSFEITNIEWNPWWFPPKASWAKNERVTPPGPTNPMGKARFAFRGPYFVHGTPDEKSLGKAASHGCIRLANADAIDLATLMQRELLGTVASDSILRTAQPSRRTMTVRLPQRVPLEIRYETVEVVADTLFVYPDPYRLGAPVAHAVAATLALAGLDTSAIDFAQVRRFTRYPAAVPIALPIRRRTPR